MTPATARSGFIERETGPAPGPDYPRWPGAPENGRRFFTCPTCGEASTLAYRCSECGAEPGGSE